jgi:uncharacterized membrane protein YheB (UPF0754 family)
MLAIRLLFRPHQPLRLGPISIQGLIPKRRHEIARALADTVESELLLMDELFNNALTPELEQDITRRLLQMVEERGRQRLPMFLPQAVRSMIIDQLQKILAEELSLNLPQLSREFAGLLRSNIDVKQIVEVRLNMLDLVQLEDLIVRLAQKELRAIEYLGGIIGFVIGLVQVAVLVLMPSS